VVNPNQSMLTEAIGAARTGDRSRARDLLSRLLRSDSANAEYWIWMSAVVDTARERVYCLESALNIDSTNRAAIRGLVVLGAREPSTNSKAVKIPRRQAIAVPRAGSRPKLKIQWRMVGTGVAALLGLLAVVGFALTYRFRPSAPILAPTLPPPTSTATATPLEPTATLTPIPVQTRIYRTPVPSELAGTPIAFLVEATPTATPMIGVTPRPNYEAYQAGLNALLDGRYEDAISFMDQVIALDPSLPDPYYFKAEALRLGGEPGQASVAYDSAILKDPDYAPAYLGRGRARLDLLRRANVDVKASDLPPDFDSAIEKDPSLIDPYIEEATFFRSLRLWKTMEEILQEALANGVRTPRIYILLSQAQFNRQEYEEALQSAINGSAGDPTNLAGYLAIGKASIALEDYSDALWPLKTYTVLRQDDPEGWGYLSLAEFGTGDMNSALASGSRALELNDRYAVGFVARAQAEIELGLYQDALDDLLKARQFGSETFRLDYNLALAYFKLARYVDSLKAANLAIAFTPDNTKKAEGYALRALVYEATNPPLVDEAKRNWGWILDTEGIDDDLRAMAESHLAILNGEVPSPTPANTATATSAATVAGETPGAPPSPTPTP
jgi:tetratricopeptide (TPR) repeat protein